MKKNRDAEIRRKLNDPIERKKLAALMVPAIRAAIEGTDVARQALFLKKTSKTFSKSVTWKDMEEAFGLNKNKCRRQYDNICWKGHWEV